MTWTFGAAGTIAGWVDAGIEVTYLLCTRGEQGGFDDTPREAMPALREKTSGTPPPRSACTTSGSWTGTATAGSNRPTSCSATSSG